jgi:hypothetical protein
MRPLRTRVLRSVLLALCLLPCGCGEDESETRSTALIASVTEPPEHTVRFADGRRLTYTYHFDRNALRASRLTSVALYALTRSGNLLALDPISLDLVAEAVQGDPAFCLGRGPGDETLVGFESGRYARIMNPALALEDLGRLPGKVRWLHRRVAPGGEILVVVHADEDPEGPDRAVEIPSGKAVSLARVGFYEVKFGTFHLDRAGRLWLGYDEGEFGAGYRWIDRGFEAVHEVPGGGGSNGLGFTELPDGRVLAFGGLSHLSSSDSFVASVDESGVSTIASYWRDIDPDAGQASRGPNLPFSHVEPLPDGQGFWVISGRRLYRTDSAFGRWENLLDLDARFHHGRRYAMGSLPPYVGRHRTPDGRLLVTTQRDGVLEIAAAGTKGRLARCPNQMELGEVWSIRVAGGTAVVGGDPFRDPRHPWVLREGAWFRHPVFPPNTEDIWREDDRAVWPAPDGTTVSFVTRLRDGNRSVCVTRWDGASPSVLAGPPLESPLSAFVAPDGSIRDGGCNLFEPIPFGSSWLLRTGTVLRTSDGKAIELMDEDGRPLRVTGALELPGASLLLATEAGLFTCDGSGKHLSRAPTSLPPDVTITRVCRDGQGRLWLAGDGLHILDGVADVPCSVPAPLRLRASNIEALAPDPEHPDGVLLAVEDRGLLRLRVSP